MASREALGSTFASLIVEEPLVERPARLLAGLEIAIGDIVVRTDATERRRGAVQPLRRFDAAALAAFTLLRFMMARMVAAAREVWREIRDAAA